MIAGRTHPDIARREGERYRVMLERRVLELGLGDHVEFDDRFLSIDGLADLLASTDVFVTPYRNREQIASGALTFALASGCPVVSTPYWYAQDMLASGAGALVPVRRPGGVGRCGLPLRRRSRGAVGGARGVAAGGLVACVAGGRESHGLRARGGAQACASPPALRGRRAPADDAAHRPPADAGGRRRDHPARVRDDPEPGHRLLRRRRRPARPGGARACPSRARSSTGRRSSIGRWRFCARPRARAGCTTSWATTGAGSTSLTSATTSAARSGRSARFSAPPGFRRSSSRPDRCSKSSSGACPASCRSEPPPTRCSASRVSTPTGSTSARGACSSVASTSSRPPTRESASDEWSWFEDRLSYDNARLAQALVVGASALERDDETALGLESLRWLGDQCGLAEDRLRLPGHHGRRRASRRPEPATSNRSTLRRSSRPSSPRLRSRGDPEHGARASRAFEWFLGRNRLDRPLYDFATGGCSDGLGSDDVNTERGGRVDARVPPRGADPRGHRGPVQRPPRVRTGRGDVSDPELFRRDPANPILTADDWPYPVNAVFNPAAVVVGDETVLLARVEDRRGSRTSRSLAPPTASTVGRWTESRCLRPQADTPSEQWGFEDPRIIWIEELEPFRDHVHRVRPRRPRGLPSRDRGLQQRRALRDRPPAGGQERRAPSPSNRRPLGALPPSEDRVRRRPRRDLRSRDPPIWSAGAPPSPCSNRVRAPGGTRSASDSARRRCVPTTAGSSSTTASRRPCPATSTGSASRCSTWPSRRESCGVFRRGSSPRRRPTSGRETSPTSSSRAGSSTSREAASSGSTTGQPIPRSVSPPPSSTRCSRPCSRRRSGG